MKKDRECDLHVINLLEDTDFLIYVLEGDVRQNPFWQKLMANDLEIRSSFYKAVDLLENSDHLPVDFSLGEMERLEERIENSLKKE